MRTTHTRTPSRARASGVTLMELLIVISMAAILMALAVPSYRYVTTTNRVAAEINGLLGDLQYARYEAIKEGVTVKICPSHDQTSCDTTTSWGAGWMVQSPANPNVALRAQSTFSSGDTLTSNGVQAISFNREGLASGLGAAGTFLSLHDATNNASYTRCLVVSVSGMLTTQHTGPIGTTGLTCT